MLHLLPFISQLLSQYFLRTAVIKTLCWWTASSCARSFSVCNLVFGAHDTVTFTAPLDGSVSNSDVQIIVPISHHFYCPSHYAAEGQCPGKATYVFIYLCVIRAAYAEAASASLSLCVWWSNHRADKWLVTIYVGQSGHNPTWFLTVH